MPLSSKNLAAKRLHHKLTATSVITRWLLTTRYPTSQTTHMAATTRPIIDFSNSIFLDSSNVSAYPTRLSWRAEILINRQKSAFAGKKVLDLASHDGRFSYAALAAGATYVVGVEGRQKHVDHAFSNLAMLGYDRSRCQFICSNLVDYLRTVEPGSFDTVLCFGVMSHLIEHVEVIREIRRINPSCFILDTAVAREQRNTRERHRNFRVNHFVRTAQLGHPAITRWQRLRSWLRAMTTDPGYRTGTMVFLYENYQADGATIAKDGLMAWSTPTLIEMLLNHYDFQYERIDWTKQGVDTKDWWFLEDYRNGQRGAWMARPSEDVHAAGLASCNSK